MGVDPLLDPVLRLPNNTLWWALSSICPETKAEQGCHECQATELVSGRTRNQNQVWEEGVSCGEGMLRGETDGMWTWGRGET